jgi:hypothetical protein
VDKKGARPIRIVQGDIRLDRVAIISQTRISESTVSSKLKEAYGGCVSARPPGRHSGLCGRYRIPWSPNIPNATMDEVFALCEELYQPLSRRRRTAADAHCAASKSMDRELKITVTNERPFLAESVSHKRSRKRCLNKVALGEVAEVVPGVQNVRKYPFLEVSPNGTDRKLLENELWHASKRSHPQEAIESAQSRRP